jgi:hypothetical protein
VKPAATVKPTTGTVKPAAAPAAKPHAQFSVSSDDGPEFEVSADQDWDIDPGSTPTGKK